MRRKLGKKLMALTMAGVMMCAPMTVFAADGTTEASRLADTGTITGAGAMEGAVNKDIIKVVLPTTGPNTSLGFILDPQSLIAGSAESSTIKDAYKDKTFEDGATVLFANTVEGHTYDYSSTSDPINIINKGTLPVQVGLTVTGRDLTSESNDEKSISLVTNDTFASDDTTSIYLAVDIKGTKTAVTSSSGATIAPVNLAGASEEAYEVKYDTSGGYSYDLKSDVTDDMFDSLSFTLTGKANPSAKAVWTDVADVAPSVDIAWALTAGVALTGTAPTFTSTTAGVIDYTKGTGDLGLTSVTSITVVGFDGVTTYDIYNEAPSLWAAATNDNTSKITLDSAACNAFIPYGAGTNTTIPATIKYTNGVGKTKTVTTTITLN